MRTTACFVAIATLLTVSAIGIWAVPAAEQKQVVDQKQTTNQTQNQHQEALALYVLQRRVVVLVADEPLGVLAR